MLRDGGTTIDCVAAVRYRFLHEGKPGTQVFTVRDRTRGVPTLMLSATPRESP